MPPIFNISQIVHLVDIIVVINTIRAITLTITKTIIIAISYGKKSVMFAAKMVVALINI